MNSVQSPDTPWQMKVYPVFTVLGWIFILVAFIVGLFVLTPAAINYWSGNAKTARDAAEVGSALLRQLVVLTSTPRWLEPFIFVGVASFMLGIALEFSSIPALLRNRGQVMSACFPYIKR